MNWLLRHLPASIVTTKFFVSPAVAVLAGWLVMGEAVGWETLESLFFILAGVGVVFVGRYRAAKG
jgi:drug/metabolite transporter (DMT)-like permease